MTEICVCHHEKSKHQLLQGGYCCSGCLCVLYRSQKIEVIDFSGRNRFTAEREEIKK